jgi:predicted amidohydrolase
LKSSIAIRRIYATFYERQFDTPPIRKVVTFDTPFGKFAVFTCFDIIFKNPAIDSLMISGVGNIVFPTAWMDALPLLAARCVKCNNFSDWWCVKLSFVE